jgi:hypothetical protein
MEGGGRERRKMDGGREEGRKGGTARECELCVKCHVYIRIQGPTVLDVLVYYAYLLYLL